MCRIEKIGKLELKRETKRFIKMIVTTIYEEQTGMRLKSRSFIDQLEKSESLLSLQKNDEHEKGVESWRLFDLFQLSQNRD